MSKPGMFWPSAFFVLGLLIPGLLASIGCHTDTTDGVGLRVEFAARVYGAGEAAGFLRIIPKGQPLTEWSNRDVVVVENAPLDLSIVSALLSAGPQSAGSHLSLRLGEKQIPNASVPGIYEWKDSAAWNGRLVHVLADGATVKLRVIAQHEAEDLWRRQRPIVGELVADVRRQDWASYAELRHRDAAAFGVKAANLGELHVVLPAVNRIAGFGIPFSAYVDFSTVGGFAPLVEEIVGDVRMASDPAWKKLRLRELRRRVQAAALPSDLLERLVTRAIEIFGTDARSMRLRFRSSTNAEDLELSSGAGLYNSRTGCLADDLDEDATGPSRCLTDEIRRHLESEIVRWNDRRRLEPNLIWIDDIVRDLESELRDEKSAVRALKNVWASLWNDRAYDERAYYGLDHRKVKMAVAVQLADKQEQLQAVAFTNVRFRGSPPFSVLFSQTGETGIVRPIDPTAQAETRLFWRTASGEVINDTVQVPSSLIPASETLWPVDRFRELTKLLHTVHEHFRANVYSHLSWLALDIELKVTRDGRLIIKQARPYLSQIPPL